MLKISGNGLCLVEAVRQAIDKDVSIKNSYNAQARKIWMEIKNQILFYNDFAPNQTSTSILKTIYDYLKKRGSYTLPIIDIMLSACATALNTNIRVWQNDNSFKNILQFDVYPAPSQKTIHLLYTRTLNAEGIPDVSLDPNNVCHHYYALILKSATDDDEEDDGLFPSDEEYMGNSLTQVTLVSTTTTTTSTSILTYSNDIEYQVEEVPHHYIMYNMKKSDRYNPFKQDMSLFMNVVTKVVGTCLFNINGNKIYQMKCYKSTWKEKLTHGRHWQINWGKNQLLNGERRVAKCQGSIVCTNNNCPMFQVHNIVNEASFSRGTLEGSYQCATAYIFLKGSHVVHLEPPSGIMREI